MKWLLKHRFSYFDLVCIGLLLSLKANGVITSTPVMVAGVLVALALSVILERKYLR